MVMLMRCAFSGSGERGTMGFFSQGVFRVSPIAL